MRDSALIALAILAHAWVPRATTAPLAANVLGWLLSAAVVAWSTYAWLRAQ